MRRALFAAREDSALYVYVVFNTCGHFVAASDSGLSAEAGLDHVSDSIPGRRERWRSRSRLHIKSVAGITGEWRISPVICAAGETSFARCGSSGF